MDDLVDGLACLSFEGLVGVEGVVGGEDRVAALRELDACLHVFIIVRDALAQTHAEIALVFVDVEAHAAELPAFRATLDGACSTPVLVYFTSAVFWLLIGTLLGIASSLKFDMPEWLGMIPELTFGRIRPAHLNAVTYGWASLAGCGCLVWLVSRLTRAPARWPGALLASAALWNIGLIYGIGAILLGYSQGVEWLEFPLPAAALVAAVGLIAAPPASARPPAPANNPSLLRSLALCPDFWKIPSEAQRGKRRMG